MNEAMREIKESNGTQTSQTLPGTMRTQRSSRMSSRRAGAVRPAPRPWQCLCLARAAEDPSAPLSLRNRSSAQRSSPDTVEPSSSVARKTTRPFGWISCEPDSISTASSWSNSLRRFACADRTD